MTPTTTYDARVDPKKRLTLRGATYDFYHVQEFADGRILLEPRQLVAPVQMSKRTLKGMDTAMDHFKKGKVSKPVDLSAFEGKQSRR